MTGFFKRNSGTLKKVALLMMMVVPFGLYFAARQNAGLLTWLLLGVMGLSMLLAIKVG